MGGAWQDRDEAAIVEVGRKLLGELVAQDDWLPEQVAKVPAHGYAQNLLWCDPFERFCVVSFVWGPGQQTPIHDHCTWGVIGMLRGAEVTTAYRESAAGMEAGEELTLEPGDVAVVSPTVGDIHLVRNAYADRVSISIHAYGANIGKQLRHVFDAGSCARKDFVSGYSNAANPAA